MIPGQKSNSDLVSEQVAVAGYIAIPDPRMVLATNDCGHSILTSDLDTETTLRILKDFVEEIERHGVRRCIMMHRS